VEEVWLVATRARVQEDLIAPKGKAAAGAHAFQETTPAAARTRRRSSGRSCLQTPPAAVQAERSGRIGGGAAAVAEAASYDRTACGPVLNLPTAVAVGRSRSTFLHPCCFWPSSNLWHLTHTHTHTHTHTRNTHIHMTK
jgi:hypothetical protein